MNPLTLLFLLLPITLATPLPQDSFNFGEPTRDVIEGSKPKPPKDKCVYGRYICDLAGQQKYCSKKYVEYMEKCVETQCVQFFRDPLADCKRDVGHGGWGHGHKDDNDEEDEDDGGLIRDVTWG